MTDRGALEDLVGVYDADHTAWGEVRYWLGARFGRRHCALCDVTHGTFRERADWRACRRALPLPFHTFHRDDQPPEVAAAVGDDVPAVVARTRDGDVVTLLGPSDLEECAGSPEELVAMVERAAGRVGLEWPTDPPPGR